MATANNNEELITLENKFWQSMVDADTDAALQLLDEPAPARGTRRLKAAKGVEPVGRKQDARMCAVGTFEIDGERRCGRRRCVGLGARRRTHRSGPRLPAQARVHTGRVSEARRQDRRVWTQAHVAWLICHRL